MFESVNIATEVIRARRCKDKTMEALRVVMANGSRRVEIEGPTGVVQKQFKELRRWVEGVGGGEGDQEKGAQKNPNAADSDERLSLRSYVSVKSPANTYEGIAVVLAYKQAHENKDELSVDEIRTAMIQAGIRPPKAMTQAMADCRRRYGYVDGGQNRGSWKLSAQGETLIEIDLPRVRN
jgi:hypothetical protein